MLHARRREMRELIRAGRVVAWPLVKYKGAIALSCITYFAIRSKSTTKIMRKLGPVPCLIVPLFTNRHWIPDISNKTFLTIPQKAQSFYGISWFLLSVAIHNHSNEIAKSQPYGYLYSAFRLIIQNAQLRSSTTKISDVTTRNAR